MNSGNEDQVKENNEFVNVFTLEDHFEEADDQWNGDGDAGLRQEKLMEGNLEQIGDGSVGKYEVDLSVELKCAREGGQLVRRWKSEARGRFSGCEASEMETVGIQETRIQDIGVEKG